jgi:pyruvate formate lyase activating enzyme
LISGIVFDIKWFAVHDGPGLRTTVFFKGCPLHCLGCHNPEGQRVGVELLFRPDRCTLCGDCVPACPHGALAMEEGDLRVSWSRCELAGACVEACLPGALELVGRRYRPQELLDLLEEDRLFYDESHGGVTFSGGEPFAQPEFLQALLEGCRQRELPVVLDTCGHAEPPVFRRLAPLASALLFDLKLVDGTRHEAFTGVHNRWILENLRWAAGGAVGDGPSGGVTETSGGVGAPGTADPLVDEAATSRPALTVRIPLIPGINDDGENLRASARFLAELSTPPPVDVLPYHRLGVDKYQRLGREYHLKGVAPPSDDRVALAVRLLQEAGLRATVRGEVPHAHDRESP